ncbi:unnamed protein product [Orchesella dallaii]|uniref:Integrase catalytic domain-containing protein n=1 Tax=Orchesella dallaii TaxID=48710 RepID=A0ABP1RVQ3_9HEXA
MSVDYVKRRSSYFTKLKSILSEIKKVPTPVFRVTQLDEFLERSKNIMAVLDDCHNQLVQICANEADITIQDQAFAPIEAAYFELRTLVMDMKLALPSTTTAGGGGGASSSRAATPATIKLPSIELPSFSGSFDTWTSFKDLFTSTIDLNRELSEAQKLQYLKAAVKDEPAALIRSLQVTNANYQQAWDTLNQRYDNKKEIINSLLMRLFESTPLNHESAVDLQKLSDNTNECVRALKVQGCPVEHWDNILVYFTVKKLDSKTRREWAVRLTGTALPTFLELNTFLDNHIRGLLASGVSSQPQQQGKQKRQVSSHHSSSSQEQQPCGACKEHHALYKCQQFLTKSPKERSELVKLNRLCFNCLRKDHRIFNCTSKATCRKCNRKHHTLLHEERPPPPQEEPQGSSGKQLSSHHANMDTQVLLSTAIVRVKTRSNGDQLCRIFLDTGSEGTFITEDCVGRLGLKRHPSQITVKGISSSSAGSTRGLVNCTLLSNANNESIPVSAHILGRVTGTLPQQPCKLADWILLQGLTLADPKYCEPGPVDILIGADYCGHIMRSGRKVGPEGAPIAQESIFGWVLSGRVTVADRPTMQSHNVQLEVEHIMQRFWQVKEPPQVTLFTKEEKECERIFYLTLGHMEEIPNDEPKEEIGKTYHLPHHFVLNSSSSTTKFRVVFDGSCKSTTGVSLNDAMYVGATIQDDLYDLLLRFRVHTIVLKGDIAKMFRQFLLKEEDANFHRIVWRESPTQNIKDYRLLTVTYGTACAPHSSTRCLQEVGKDSESKYPSAAKVLKEDAYVDDVMTGTTTTTNGVQLYKELTAAVGDAGLELRKWSSNDPDVLAAIPSHLQETDPHSFDKETSIKALGVQWNPTQDVFSFCNFDVKYREHISKRLLLSDLARVFDPLGFLSAVTIKAKMIMQEIWTLKFGWDEPLPTEIQQQWKDYCSQLQDIRKVIIPRCITVSSSARYEIHGFCDASERAYGVVLYLRAIGNDGQIKVSFITSKAKVAPLKQVTLARLELIGAVMLSKLMNNVQLIMKLDCELFAWCDSTIVLRWIAAHPRRWKTFVANRVAQIQEHTPVEIWRHVPGIQNPADLASRGITATELNNNVFWWNGPPWLQHHQIPLFHTSPASDSTDMEERKITLTANTSAIDSSLLDRYSNLVKLQRVTAYILRFYKAVKSKSKMTGSLSTVELSCAHDVLVKLVQQQHFGKEISVLKLGQVVSATSPLRSLYPFIDQQGIMRVGGRLNKADLPEGRKHQIILPRNSNFITILINHVHHEHLHSGFQLTWSVILSQYWIVRGRDTVRHIVRKCVVCRRYRAKAAKQLMAPLPSPRVNPSRPFLNTGVDYAGPFNLRNMKGRGNTTYKCYMSLFICMATKAIHLEAVSDLTTASFIAAFRRFVSRRGLCANLYSDCGTNFIGANKELKRLCNSQHHNTQVTEELTKVGSQWHFNSPSSPHHGGLWEAGVKSAKYHLKRVIGDANFNFEQFQTVLCQVEAVLNSRPLCPVSADPTDLNVLTPGHFLIGKRLTSVPDDPLIEIKENRLSIWQRQQQRVQHFWRRWRMEYLNTLQQRNKWFRTEDNFRVGDMVILKEDNEGPSAWKIGRIAAVHPGTDGNVRVVSVRTSTGILKRPIAKLIMLLDKNLI